MENRKLNKICGTAATLALVLSSHALADTELIGRCEQAAAIQVEILANDMNERAINNQGRATDSALTLISNAIRRGEITQMLSVYGEEGQAAICFSACAHGIGTLPSFEFRLTPELQSLKARLTSLSRSGPGFASVRVRDLSQMRECMRGN